MSNTLSADRPYAWLVVGQYRAPHMRRHSTRCSCTVYTARKNRGDAEKTATAQFSSWMVIQGISLIASTEG